MNFKKDIDRPSGLCGCAEKGGAPAPPPCSSFFRGCRPAPPPFARCYSVACAAASVRANQPPLSFRPFDRFMAAFSRRQGPARERKITGERGQMPLVLAYLLLVSLLLTPCLPHAAGSACSNDSDCYGGSCRRDGGAGVSRCVCPRMWRGANCELLNLAPASVDGGLRLRNESTWGGGLIQDADDPTVWHMYYAHFVGNCGLKTWTTNSEIRHAVASQIAGPYTPVEASSPVLRTFAHNPTVQHVGPGSWLLGHIGCGNGSKSPVGTCTNGTTCNHTGWCHSPGAGELRTKAEREQGASCDNPHWTGFHHAPSPRGPWAQVETKPLDDSCGLQVNGGFGSWHQPCITNPSIWPFENGSALVAYSTGCANCTTSAGHKHIGLAFAPSGFLGDEALQDLTPIVPIFPW
jgi:hypothetical protein